MLMHLLLYLSLFLLKPQDCFTFEREKDVIDYIDQQVTELMDLISKQDQVIKDDSEKIINLESIIEIQKRVLRKRQMEILGLRRMLNDIASSKLRDEEFGNRCNETLSQDIAGKGTTKLMRNRRVATEPVGFFAYLSSTESSPSTRHQLIFNSLLTNTGSAYNRYVGTFVAKQSGTYVFTWTIVVSSGGVICTELVVDSSVYGRTYTHSYSEYQTTTGVVVAYVSAGHDVMVRTCASHSNSGNIMSDSYRRSSFAGWLLG